MWHDRLLQNEASCIMQLAKETTVGHAVNIYLKQGSILLFFFSPSIVQPPESCLVHLLRR